MNSVPSSDSILYLGHMLNRKVIVDEDMWTIMSGFSLGMGKASSHPVKWSMMVRMYWFPDVETFRSVTKSVVILSKG